MLHKFTLNGENIVVDVNSGAIHTMDPVAFHIVEEFPCLEKEELLEKYKGQFPQQELAEAMEELAELQKQALLYTKDPYDCLNLPKKTAIVKALCLHVAHDCNLRCQYCFADEGEYHGKRSLMSFEVGKAALDFLLTHSGSRKNLEVDFFGGEPLMNLEVVKQLVDYGRSQEEAFHKRFRFTITTNGLQLDEETADYINETMHNVVLSLDGRKKVHDAMRPRQGGQGSYDAVVPNMQSFVKKRGEKEYFVRGTFTKNNLDFCQDVLHMYDLGFRKISIEPVVAAPDAPYAIQKEDLPTIYQEYEKLAEEICRRNQEGNPFYFFHFQMDFTGGPCIYKRIAGCGSGTEYLAVTPEGDFYPCHQFVGMEEFKLGTVYSGIENANIQEQFSDCNVYHKPKCRDCWAKFYCSGGCTANAYQYGGGLQDAYDIGCDLQRKRVECAMMIKAKDLAKEDNQ